MKKYLDLRQIQNHRMVFPEHSMDDNQKNMGVGYTYALDKSFIFEKILYLKKESCIFQNNSQLMDNVVCSGQVYTDLGCPCNKITFFGFCSWGYYKEYFQLIFADRTTKNVAVHFADVTGPLFQSAHDAIGRDKQDYLEASQIFCNIVCNDRIGYMYYCESKLQEIKNLEKIVFPDNCFMHIFAITVEGN